jgi:hypothetical protein
MTTVARRHGFERARQVRIRHDQRQGGGRADELPDFGELVLVASGHRPFDRVGRSIVFEQVLRDEPTGVAGGAKNDDVELPGHFSLLERCVLTLQAGMRTGMAS